LEKEENNNDKKKKPLAINSIKKSIVNHVHTNVSFFPSITEKNSFHKNVLKYKEDFKNIVKHVCYCCQRLYFKYQFFIA
jgi:hypothetical protein